MADTLKTVFVPDIGGAENVDIIEILVSEGDEINIDDSIMTLEGDKATMDVPAPMAGTIKSIEVAVGDKVSEGSKILTLVANDDAASQEDAANTKNQSNTEAPTTKEKAPEAATQASTKAAAVAVKKSDEKPTQRQTDSGAIHAGPGVRRLISELDLDVSKISASGPKGRITKDDIKRYIQAGVQGGNGLQLIDPPKVDFSKYGKITHQPLSKINKYSGANLHRNWVTIPHVTQFDEADITELEAYRQEQKVIAAKQNVRLTPLVFIMKAVVSALKAFPRFNASLDHSGEQLILKEYFHIGVAVDTPNGLVVPVIKDVDTKGVIELAKELGEISTKARETGLSMADMQGGCFTISSLGGIGGTAFTPIINAPEVAILGVSRSQQKPVYQKNGELVPRLMLPLSISYDHRVIDGAEAARFTVFLSSCLTDIRNNLL